MTMDPLPKRICLSSAKFDSVLPPDSETPHQRPNDVPDSMKVLVYEPDGL